MMSAGWIVVALIIAIGLALLGLARWMDRTSRFENGSFQRQMEIKVAGIVMLAIGVVASPILYFGS